MDVSVHKTIATKRDNLKKYLSTNLRDTLSEAKVSVQLCLIALPFALVASAVIMLFRLLLVWFDTFTQTQALNFTDIIDDWRVLLPLIGAFLIWAVARMGSKRYKRMGIAYVIHRVKLHYGKIPLPSAPAQFFQALFALATNFSVGREGPAIHLGAVSASVLAEKFKLPDNSVRIMCSSGIAAGIAAIFNAPLAAVIFVFEVVLREYRIHYFFPIMTSAICGALSSQMVFGNVHEFDQIGVAVIPLSQYFFLTLFGVVLGCIAALFNRTLLSVTNSAQQWPLLHRLVLAGVITTLVGLVLPQAIGSGDLVIAETLAEHPSIGLLLAILVGKMIATIAAIGLGIPGGLIGPLYSIGALLGTILALMCSIWFPSIAPYMGLYTIIGMTGMMGVCLSAPLASLVALIELTDNASIILPSMFVVIPAFLISQQGFKTKSIFFKQLEIMGLGYKVAPVNLGLQKVGVRHLMDKQVVVANKDSPRLLDVIKHAEGRSVLVRNAQRQVEMLQFELQTNEHATTLTTHPIQGIADTATLNEVYILLSQERRGAVYIYQNSDDNIVGVINWARLQKQIQSGQA
ncbi:chloride channel protein [Shewanella youngdeokensis]|uniref:Chloride channel protein n=1 Tax=Shewanella youngdeokensis TaxID=2999068 RepID=A0ABZ0K4R3_9GAMM|nr:chloride channel protein [Shewanella sp. DAU334]